MSAATELQSLEREIALLKKVLKSCQSASTEMTSVAATRIFQAITTQQPSVHNNNLIIMDHFAPLPIPKATTTTTNNTAGSHTAASRTVHDPDESGGCCVVS